MARERDLSLGDRPIVWTNCVGGGRSIDLTMGHNAEAYEQPQVHRLLVNSLDWLFDAIDCTSPPPLPAPAR